LRGSVPSAHTGQTPAETAKSPLASALPQSLASLAGIFSTRIPLIDILNVSKSSRIRSPRNNPEAKKIGDFLTLTKIGSYGTSNHGVGRMDSSFLPFQHIKDGYMICSNCGTN